MAFPMESQIIKATMECSCAYPAARPGLQDLLVAVNEIVDTNLMALVENELLCLSVKARRLLSHYGAVGGCSAGHNWVDKSYDATNVIYAAVWEYWKGAEHWSQFPSCQKITHWNTAGNIVEALLGVAWIHLHHPQGQDLDAIEVSDAEKEEAWGFVRAWGSQCAVHAPVLEHGIIGMLKVYEACPCIQTCKAAYNNELMQAHLEALRLGFPSGLPFYVRRLPVFPLAIHPQMYPEDIRCELEQELKLIHASESAKSFAIYRWSS